MLVGCVGLGESLLLSEIVDEGFVEVESVAVIDRPAIEDALAKSPNFHGAKGMVEKWFVKGGDLVLLLVYDEKSYISERCGYSKTVMKRSGDYWVVDSELFLPCESRV